MSVGGKGQAHQRKITEVLHIGKFHLHQTKGVGIHIERALVFAFFPIGRKTNVVDRQVVQVGEIQ